MGSEVAARADFSGIRYAQCWEDADILLDALNVGPGHVCLSIASAGDNALAMLTRDPARVVALDLSPAQLACLELRVCAYRNLAHEELLELIGVERRNEVEFAAPEAQQLELAVLLDLQANAVQVRQAASAIGLPIVGIAREHEE